MTKFKILFLLISLALINLSFAHKIQAEFLTTYSVNSSTVKKLNEWIDRDTVIFLEIDDVLLMPKSKMFSYDTNPYRLFIDNLLSYSKKNPAYKKSIARWYGQREVKLVETAWLGFIKSAREKGARIYGICSMPLYLTNIEEKRLAELKSLGIELDKEINGIDELILTKNSTWPARFYQGIMFIGGQRRSTSLLELIKKTNLSPEKMISFGRIDHEVKSIDQMLRRFNMYFKNILYLGTRNIKGKPDPEIVKFQQKQLIEQGKWYEDNEAKKLLRR